MKNSVSSRDCLSPQIRLLSPDRRFIARPANPRQHSKKQIRQIARSIAAFGFNVPLLVDAELKVIVGHGRLMACQELGWSEVPTLCLDHLTSAQARLYDRRQPAQRDRRLGDDRLLAEHLKDLSLLGLDFNLEVSGFEVDLRRFSGEALGQPAACFSNCAGLEKSRAEWRRTGL